MKKKDSLLILLLLISITSVTAQQTKGIILDSETKEPIPFVSVAASPFNGQGIVGNVNGEFFINKSIITSDTVAFSCLGYETIFIAISEIDNNKTIYLSPKSISLSEVVILSTNALLNEVWNNIPNNYPENNPLLKSRYRKQIAGDDRLIFIGECEMLIRPYTLKEGQEFKEARVRFSDKKIFASGLVPFLRISYKIPPPHYPSLSMVNPKFHNDFSYTQTPSNEDGIYKVEFINNKNNNQEQKGHIYISSEDKAVLSLHHEMRLENMSVKNPLGRSEGVSSDITLILDYFWTKIDFEYQLSYVRGVCTFYISGKENSKKLKDVPYKYSVVIDYFITERGGESSASFRKIEDPFKNVKDATEFNASHFTLIPSDFSYE